jgi:hypothetical protein
MSAHFRLKFVFLLSLATALLLSGFAYGGQKREDERGESPKARALKNRRAAPRPADIDTSVTLAGLLDKKAERDWATSKAAVVEGYVIQVEKEEDGDLHIVLADDPQGHDTRKWVIIEVTPAWRKRKASLSEARLRQLIQKQVRVTGWLFYEPEEEQGDPRGTRWELHPVTDIVVIKK